MTRTGRSLQYVLGVLLVVIMVGCGDAMQGVAPGSGNAATSTPITPAAGAARSAAAPATPPGGIPAGHRDVGILDRHDGPFPGPLFGVVNVYSGPYQGQWLTIYAGGDKDPRQIPDPFVQGAIRIMLSPADPSAGSPTYIGEFDAPASSTWVKVVAVSGSTVTLQRQDGSEVRFNLNDHTFCC